VGRILDPIYIALAKTITFWHDLLSRIPGLTAASGVTWALAIVMLVVTVRLLLFPVFVKQIRSQRAMQELQPRIKALQTKHKGDRETLNQEMMKLYKEAGVNPLAGCLPLLLQMPIFIGLFQVLRQLGPKIVDGALEFPEKFGVPQSTAEEFGRAKLFGAPIAAGFNSPKRLLDLLNAQPTSVKVVCVFLIVAMSLTQFITTKQIMAKNSANADAAQATQQKVLLYVMPVMFALFGFSVPLGVLLYWTTTNLWSMGQQAYVIKRMPHTPAGMPVVDDKHMKAATAKERAGTKADSAPAPRARSRFGRAAASGATAKSAPATRAAAESDAPTDESVAGAGTAPRPNQHRPPSAKARKKARARKGGRR
jgi:YidC/Oxa1 family membrane protein insertase